MPYMLPNELAKKTIASFLSVKTNLGSQRRTQEVAGEAKGGSRSIWEGRWDPIETANWMVGIKLVKFWCHVMELGDIGYYISREGEGNQTDLDVHGCA